MPLRPSGRHNLVPGGTVHGRVSCNSGTGDPRASCMWRDRRAGWHKGAHHAPACTCVLPAGDWLASWHTQHLVLEPGMYRVPRALRHWARDSASSVSAGATWAPLPQAALQNAAALNTALDSSNGQLPQLGGCAADPTLVPQSPPAALPILTLPVLARLCDVSASPSRPTHPRKLGEPSLRRQVTWVSLCAASRERESSETYQAPSRWPHGHMLFCPDRLVGLTQLRQAATHVPFPLRTCCRWRLGQSWSPDGVHDISIKSVTQCGSRTASGRAGVLASAPPPGQPGSLPGVGSPREWEEREGQTWQVSGLLHPHWQGSEALRCRWHQDPGVCWLRLYLLPGMGPSD